MRASARAGRGGAHARRPCAALCGQAGASSDGIGSSPCLAGRLGGIEPSRYSKVRKQAIHRGQSFHRCLTSSTFAGDGGHRRHGVLEDAVPLLIPAPPSAHPCLDQCDGDAPRNEAGQAFSPPRGLRFPGLSQVRRWSCRMVLQQRQEPSLGFLPTFHRTVRRNGFDRARFLRTFQRPAVNRGGEQAAVKVVLVVGLRPGLKRPGDPRI